MNAAAHINPIDIQSLDDLIYTHTITPPFDGPNFTPSFLWMYDGHSFYKFIMSPGK